MKTRRRSRKLRGGGENAAAIIGNEITATIVEQASTQVLRITMPPGSTIVTDQNTMSHMTGNLVTNAKMGGGDDRGQQGSGLFNAIKRAVSGESLFVNHVTNPTSEMAEITLAPTIPSAIAEITINPGDEWKLYPGALIAATNNVKVSGSINIFDNFSSSLVTGSPIYTSVSVDAGSSESGRVWISGFGGIEKRDIKASTTPFVINNGVFLAVPAKYWNTYIKVGTAGGILNSFMTSIGFVMKIQADTDANTNPTIPLYMQTINIHNFKEMIRTIAVRASDSASRTQITISE